MKKVLLGVTALTVLAPPFTATAIAQSSLEEVVVTAQRRLESIQNIPISVTAFTTDTLIKANITEAKDYLQFSPNISFAEGGQRGNRSLRISIRGVSNVGLSELNVSDSIGYYFDEVSVGYVASGIPNPQLYDIERIEVLRGPQGTYFGRNSMGGALNITTKKPTENLYAEASGHYGRFNTWGVEGIVNVPVTENFFLRGVAAYEESDGLIKNINPNGAPNSGYEHNYFRLSARVLPTENLTVDLSVGYTDEDEGHDATVNSGVIDLDTKSIFGDDFAALPDGVGFYPNNKRFVNHNHLEYNKNEVLLLTGAITYDGDGFQVKSITGYMDSKNGRAFDQDRTSSDLLTRLNDYSAESFSQEVRIQSAGEDTFKWTVGAIYSHDKLKQFNSVRAGSETSYTDPVTGDVLGPLLPPIPEGFRINENNRITTFESYAVFGEVTWNATEQLGLTVGGRYTHDKVTYDAFGVVAFEALRPDAVASKGFDNFAPRAVVNYAVTEDVNTYVSVAHGYKAGGNDITYPGGVPLTTSFRPEKLWSYEAGVKTELADGRVRLNAAVFYLDWKDLQVQSIFLLDPNDISSSIEMTLNAAKVRNKGFEADMLALLAEGLQFGLGVGYLDSQFKQFPNAVLRGNNQVDLSGRRVPNTPKWTFNAHLEYDVPVGNNYSPYVRAEWIHRTGGPGDLEASAAPELGLPDFPYQRPSFHVFNLRAGVEMENLTISGYVENIFKENYYTGTQDAFGLGGIRIRPTPRTWGLRLTAKFGS